MELLIPIADITHTTFICGLLFSSPGISCNHFVIHSLFRWHVIYAAWSLIKWMDNCFTALQRQTVISKSHFIIICRIPNEDRRSARLRQCDFLATSRCLWKLMCQLRDVNRRQPYRMKLQCTITMNTIRFVILLHTTCRHYFAQSNLGQSYIDVGVSWSLSEISSRIDQ